MRDYRIINFSVFVAGNAMFSNVLIKISHLTENEDRILLAIDLLPNREMTTKENFFKSMTFISTVAHSKK